MEVFNIFSGLLTQEGLSRIESQRQCQSMVPDFRIVLPQGSESRPVLHELKIISSNQTRYRPTMEKRGVDKRAGEMLALYVSKARQADRLYGGNQVGETGKVERKLLSFPKVEGIIFGNWGEASEAVHNLVEVLATSRVRVMMPQMSRKGRMMSEEGSKAQAVGYIRRRLGVSAVKAQCLSLLGRLEGLGPGTMMAAKRRKQALKLEKSWARERMAQSVSCKQGFSVIRRGFAKLD